MMRVVIVVLMAVMLFGCGSPARPTEAPPPTINMVIDVATATPSATSTRIPTLAPIATLPPTSFANVRATVGRLTPSAVIGNPDSTSTPLAVATATRTLAPTKVPTKRTTLPPTAAPPTPSPVAPSATGEGGGGGGGHTFTGTTVDPPWWPCAQGQIKGNLNSMIYHVPTARDYARTYANVQCFNTEAEAQAAGFRRAKR